MIDLSHSENQIALVNDFNSLISIPFAGRTNAICMQRELDGNFLEIINCFQVTENLMEITESNLNELKLSPAGKKARDLILDDLKRLKEIGAAPVVNIIDAYEKDDFFIPTDVYSYHVDRAPIPTETYLCTYYGASSEILANSKGIQKIQMPELRAKLKTYYDGPEEGFEHFLSEHHFDLHYAATSHATPTVCGLGNLWKIAIDYPDCRVLPCLHRAPASNGKKRLILIC